MCFDGHSCVLCPFFFTHYLLSILKFSQSFPTCISNSVIISLKSSKMIHSLVHSLTHSINNVIINLQNDSLIHAIVTLTAGNGSSSQTNQYIPRLQKDKTGAFHGSSANNTQATSNTSLSITEPIAGEQPKMKEKKHGYANSAILF